MLVVCSDASARIYDRDGALAYLGMSSLVLGGIYHVSGLAELCGQSFPHHIF